MQCRDSIQTQTQVNSAQPKAIPPKPLIPPPSLPQPEAWPDYFCLSSNGPAAELHSGALGLYKLSSDMCVSYGWPVYKQMEDVRPHPYRLYLWRNSSSTWSVSSEVGGGGTTYLTLTTKNTHFRNGVEIHDAKFTVRPLDQPPPACTISLTCSSPPEDMKHPDLLGEYEATEQYTLGRRVYKHRLTNYYLRVYDGDGDGKWVVQSEVGGEEEYPLDIIYLDDIRYYLCSSDAPTICPAEPRGPGQDFKDVTLYESYPYPYWSYLPTEYQGHMRDFGGLMVKCLTHNKIVINQKNASV